MSARAKVTAAVVLLIILGGVLFGLRSCGGAEDGAAPEGEGSADPAPSESLAPVKMSTDKIVDAIKTRLDQNAGEPTRVECPKKVEQKVGTTFECEVFFAEQPNTPAVSTAVVEINGPDGAFVWEATPN